MFKFKKREELDDGRSIFANCFCELLYKKHNSDLPKIIVDPMFSVFYYGAEEHVRNIYEIIDNEIPLFAYFELITLGQTNYDFTDEEYNEAVNNSITACKEYYKK